MKPLATEDLQQAVACLNRGEIIAYPTEAVYGLGCNPFRLDAVARLLELKQRSLDKGLILVAATWDQVEMLVEPIPPPLLAQILNSWPGPTTWIFPASSHVPTWIRGQHQGVALRISNHPVVQELCLNYGGPIVSTSANYEGQPPLRDYLAVQMVFGKQVNFVVNGKVGEESKPTTIRDVGSGDIIRN